MVRPKRKKAIAFSPSVTYFKPAGICLKELEEVVLTYEELESLRLKDLLDSNQEEAALQMNISQPTFHRLIVGARKKIVNALVNGKAIKITGGNYHMKENSVSSEANQTIAIASSSRDLEGTIDSRFGRSRYFLLVCLDEKGEVVSFQAIENTGAEKRGGAGLSTAKMLAEHHVDAILAETIGPRALDILRQLNIQTYQAKGTIHHAIDNFIQGNLETL